MVLKVTRFQEKLVVTAFRMSLLAFEMYRIIMAVKMNTKNMETTIEGDTPRFSINSLCAWYFAIIANDFRVGVLSVSCEHFNQWQKE